MPYAAFSVGFIGYSLSFHWSHFRGSEVAGQDLRAKVMELESTAHKAQAQSSLVVDKTTELAKYSEHRADDEDLHGNTCDDRSGRTQGKRYQVRVDDNREAKSLAQLANQQLLQLEKLTTRIWELADARDGISAAAGDLDGVSNQLMAFINDNPTIADIRDRVEQRLRLSQNGYELPGYGLTRCPDPVRDALLNGVLKATKMPGLIFVDVLNPESVSDAQKRIWGRAVSTVIGVCFWAIGGHAGMAGPGEQLDRYDYGALITASFVEFSVLMCLLWLPRPPRGIEELANDIQDLNDEKHSSIVITALERLFRLDPRAAAILEKIEDHFWWPDAAGDPILVMPVAPKGQAELVLYRIAEILVEADRAQIPRSWTMHALNIRWWLNAPRHLRKLARGAVLRLYRIDRHAYRQLMLALALRRCPPEGPAPGPAGGPVFPPPPSGPKPPQSATPGFPAISYGSAAD